MSNRIAPARDVPENSNGGGKDGHGRDVVIAELRGALQEALVRGHSSNVGRLVRPQASSLAASIRPSKPPPGPHSQERADAERVRADAALGRATSAEARVSEFVRVHRPKWMSDLEQETRRAEELEVRNDGARVTSTKDMTNTNYPPLDPRRHWSNTRGL